VIISNIEQNGTINGNVTITSEKVFELYDTIMKQKDEIIQLKDEIIKQKDEVIRLLEEK